MFMLAGHPFKTCLEKMTSLVTLVCWIANEIMFFRMHVGWSLIQVPLPTIPQ
jgi:hypothetical protein